MTQTVRLAFMLFVGSLLSIALIGQNPAPDQAVAPAVAPVVIPAGTPVLMVLNSPLAQYLSHSWFGHLSGHSRGSGLRRPRGDSGRDPGSRRRRSQQASWPSCHLERTAGFQFRFTTMVFPNKHSVSIVGVLQSLPGSNQTRVEGEDRRLTTVDQAERLVRQAALGAVGGALLGSVSRFGVGTLPGAGLGAGLGLTRALLKRGDEISLPRGTEVEMVLQSPVSLDQEQALFNAQYVPEDKSSNRRLPTLR